MKTCVLATNNTNKVKELNAMLRSESVRITSLPESGLVFVPEESGTTFEENAIQKATETAEMLKKIGHGDMIVLADDSGLSIDALDGEPGVDSALFLGADTPYDIRNAHLIEMMDDVPDEKRTARFICVIACVLPDGRTFATNGEIEGIISRTPQGDNGFGYDPIFFIPSFGKTTAQLSQNDKNKISHRGKAFRKMIEKLKKERII
ncbi:MAG: RdgB/HAM1 family non-canonical purine NTP pyrophosphatase [Defluviitaleaceae bacterium]|nr:RdgB/HAM1 family non-canonical purine NTP pyrophosphatase [Defluviitaleaceae bacterium]